MDKIQEIYERYKHLDHLLCDRDWLGNSLIDDIIYDLWNAIRASVLNPETKDGD